MAQLAEMAGAFLRVFCDTWCERCGMADLDVSRLLAGLQRGAVPGADGSVEFLCKKFSSLIDRLKQAEANEAAERENYTALEAKLQAEEQEADAERRRLEVATLAAREETRQAELTVTEVVEKEMISKEEVMGLKAETEALVHRKRLLEETCRTEHARMGEAQGRLRRQQLSKPQMLEDVRRLQGQLQTSTTRSSAITAEMEVLQSRSLKDEEMLLKLKSELASEEEAREEAFSSATVRREDLDQALTDSALLQEQMTERQVAIQRIHGECQRCNHHRLGIRDETEKHRRWLKEAQKELESLSNAERQLEQVQAETAQLRAQLKVEEEEARQIEQLTLSKKAELADTEEKLEKQTEHLQQVEKQRDQVRSEVAAAEEEEAKVLASVEQLRHDQVAGTAMHRNLETELAMLNSEANDLRAELALLKTEKLEAEQRVQLVMPALHQARRRVKELECQVEAAHGELSHEKDLGERLERETDVCQDTVRSLRDENVRLAEQCTKLEAQLVQVSRVVAAPMRVRTRANPEAPRSPAALRRKGPCSVKSLGSRPRPSDSRQAPTEDGGPNEPSKLQYLSDYIRKEEGKLSGVDQTEKW